MYTIAIPFTTPKNFRPQWLNNQWDTLTSARAFAYRKMKEYPNHRYDIFENGKLVGVVDRPNPIYIESYFDSYDNVPIVWFTQLSDGRVKICALNKNGTLGKEVMIKKENLKYLYAYHDIILARRREE